MSYTVTDIIELARHHLYLSETTDDRGAANIEELIRQLQAMIGYQWSPLLWCICDTCGCSVEASLINEDGPNYTADGGFYCSDCWPGPAA